MNIYSVFDDKFIEYGRIINDDFKDILNYLSKAPCPSDKTLYVASDPILEKCFSFETLKHDYFGDADIQLGYCNGYNNTLNALEYHKSSEINLSPDEFILLLGKVQDIKDLKYDTKNVVAFKVPKNTAVEIYSTTLHFAPISVDNNQFRVLVVLPKGTNTLNILSEKDKTLWMTNKWLICHEDSPQAKKGAYIGLVGENIRI